jgi:hypothetical protein
LISRIILALEAGSIFCNVALKSVFSILGISETVLGPEETFAPGLAPNDADDNGLMLSFFYKTVNAIAKIINYL